MPDLLILFGVAMVFAGAMAVLNLKSATMVGRFTSMTLMWAGIMIAADDVLRIAWKAWR